MKEDGVKDKGVEPRREEDEEEGGHGSDHVQFCFHGVLNPVSFQAELRCGWSSTVGKGDLPGK